MAFTTAELKAALKIKLAEEAQGAPAGVTYSPADAVETAPRESISDSANQQYSRADRLAEQRRLSEEAILRRKLTEASLPPEIGVGEGMLRSGAHGLLFGASDEIAGGLGAMGQALMGRTLEGFGENYEQIRDSERAQLAEFREDRPGLALGAEVAGAIPTALLPFLNAGRIPSVWNAARTAAGQGGIYGFMEADGGIGDRARGGVEGVAAGGLIGGALGGVAKAGGGILNNIRNRRAAKRLGIEPGKVYRATEGAAPEGTVATVAAREALGEAGEEGRLIDAGEGFDVLANRAVETSPSAGAALRDVTQPRADDAVGEVTRVLDGQLEGAPQGGLRSATREMREETSQAVTDAYNKAWATTPDPEKWIKVLEVIKRVPEKTLRNAIDNANEAIQVENLPGWQGRILDPRKLGLADPGDVAVAGVFGGEVTGQLTLRQVNELKIALDAIARESQTIIGTITGQGRRAQILARELRRTAGDASPAYDTAVRLGGDQIKRDQSLLLGSKVFKPAVTLEDVTDMISDLSDSGESMAAMKAGVRRAVVGIMEGVKQSATDPSSPEAKAAATLFREMSSGVNRDKLVAVVGADAAEDILKKIDQAASALGVNMSVLRKIPVGTTRRTSLTLGDDAASQRGRLPVSIRGAAAAAGAALLRGSAKRGAMRDDRVAEGLVRALTEKVGPDAAEALEELIRAKRRTALSGVRTGEAKRWGGRAGGVPTMSMINALMARGDE